MRVLTIDDEPLSRARLRMFLAEHEDVQIVAEAGDPREALRALGEHNPEVIFVDIEMPHSSGVEMVRALDPEDRPLVVFVTAFADYAVDAFSVGAVHYLVKPFGADDVDAAVRRLREALSARAAGATLSQLLAGLRKQQEPELLQRLVVKRNGRVLLLRIEQIDWIEAAGNYSRVHAGGEHHLLRESMAALEKRLDRRQFVRVHRSVLVNLDRIRELHPESHGDYTVILHDDTRLSLSRGYRARLEALLGRL
jgi:two-component system LytT family response regulator